EVLPALTAGRCGIETHSEGQPSRQALVRSLSRLVLVISRHNPSATRRAEATSSTVGRRFKSGPRALGRSSSVDRAAEPKGKRPDSIWFSLSKILPRGGLTRVVI